MTWRLARSLETLRDEINAAAPNRSKASDGTIGDTSHSARASDHNPNASGVVRAMDITDGKPTLSAGDLAEAVVELGRAGTHPALGAGAYVIWDREIASATYGWRWRPYSGSNPHNKHCHISVATAASGYGSTAPWGVMEDDMALSAEDRAEIDQIKQAQDRIEDQLATLLNVVRKKGSNAWERDVDLKALVKEVLAEAREK